MWPRAHALLGLVRPRAVQVDGLPLTVPPGVLDPVLFRSGAWFAARVAARVRAGERLLDLGTGSGVVGLLAQRAGARVVGVDVEPRAVAAARANGLADVRQGDLFAPLGEEAFDLVAFNPPYLEGAPRGRLDRGRALDRALHGGGDLDTVRRFGAEVGRWLAPGGRVLVCWSDRAPAFPRASLAGTWTEQEVAVVEGERLSLWVRAAPPAEGGR